MHLESDFLKPTINNFQLFDSQLVTNCVFLSGCFTISYNLGFAHKMFTSHPKSYCIVDKIKQY